MKVSISDSIKKEIIKRAQELHVSGLESGPSNIQCFENINICINKEPEVTLYMILKEDKDNPLEGCTIYLGA